MSLTSQLGKLSAEHLQRYVHNVISHISGATTATAPTALLLPQRLMLLSMSAQATL
jgi:hypothetical protein